MAKTQSRITASAASRPWGPWLFTGIWVVFWGLLALSGLDRFKDLAGAGHRYAIAAAQLSGVRHLRVERNPGETHSYMPQTRVVLGGTSEMALTLESRFDGRRGGSRKPAQASSEARPELPIKAFREGDILVLRWLPPVRTQGQKRSEDDDMWIREITLPPQFHNLSLSHAVVEALEPVERLTVSGRSVEVRGKVAHLDLQSARCGRCAMASGAGQADDCAAHAQHGRDATLEVMAGSMQSVRIAADMGQVVLKATQGLQKLDLRLGDDVALSVDRVGVLQLARHSEGDADGGGCGAASGSRPMLVPSSPLELVRIEDRPAQGQ